MSCVNLILMSYFSNNCSGEFNNQIKVLEFSKMNFICSCCLRMDGNNLSLTRAYDDILETITGLKVPRPLLLNVLLSSIAIKIMVAVRNDLAEAVLISNRREALQSHV